MPIKKTVKTSILFGLAMTTSFSSSLVCLSGAQADSCSILTNKEIIDISIKKTVKTLSQLSLANSISLVCLSQVQAETSPILGRQGLKIGSTTNNSNAAIGVGSVHVGSSATTKSYQVTNTVISGSSPIKGSLITNNITDSHLSGLGLSAYSYGPLNAGQLTENLGITFTPVGAGALTNQFVNINDSTNNNIQKLAVTVAAYDYAKASTLPTTVDLGNVHVGAVTSQALTLFNRAPTSAYSEKLDAGVTSISGAATAAGVVNLLAGGSSSTNLSVGVNTGTAGNKTGAATFAMISDGTCTSALANTSLSSQTVNVSANVFRLAENVTKPNPINFSSSHVGDEVSQTLNITNKAINDGYSEKLDASFGVAGGDANHNNVGISQLAAGASNNDMVVSLDTQTAGAKAGTITIDYQSHGVGTSGLGFSGLSSEILKVSGDVYNYVNVLLGSSGYGSFSSGAVNQYTLDFGDISKGSGLFTANLSVMNNGLNSEWTDLLDGQFDVNAISAWTVFGKNDQLEFANIFGGSSFNGFNFGLDTLALNIGQYAGDITLNLLGHNKSGYQGVLSSIYLHINANVFAQPIVPSFRGLQTTVPEPGILWLFGCAGLGLLGYRSRSIR